MSIPERGAGTGAVDSDRVFILRFWIERESAPSTVPIWRAKVSDVMSGHERHMDGVEAALAHVREEMAAATTD
jgi:hypothetical protein